MQMCILPIGELFRIVSPVTLGVCVCVCARAHACVHMYTVGCQPLLYTLLVLCLVKHHNYQVIQVICLTVVKQRKKCVLKTK